MEENSNRAAEGEINQRPARRWGGKRPGAGRKPGSRTKNKAAPTARPPVNARIISLGGGRLAIGLEIDLAEAMKMAMPTRSGA